MVTALLVSGCGNGSTGTDDTTAESEVDAASHQVTVPISAVQTSVEDHGAEPRQVLTFRASPGTPQSVVLRTENDVHQQIDGKADQDFSTAPLAIPLDATARDGGVDLVLGRIDTPDEELAEELAPAEGSAVGLTVAPDGAVTAVQFTPAGDAGDEARSAIEQAFYQAVYHTVVFPDAEIGVGAVWTVRQQITGGVTLDQVTTATLTALDGNRATVALDITQTPRANVWNLPDGAGMLDIDYYVMHGTGTMTLDLELPLPVDGRIETAGEQRYRDPEGKSTLYQSTSSLVQWGG